MPTVVGVRLRPAGKVLTFDAAGTSPETGDVVVVSTERGEEMGEIAIGLEEIDEKDVTRKLKPVLRIATERDLQIADELSEKESRAMKRYRELVHEHKLDMKPVSVEALFDGRKIVFYFTAEERVDFRDLVKDLAREFKARIDMRQIGVRDEARMVGGLGHCGQQLCCVRFGGEFEPVSIRMAKAQDLPLNPLKISGLCGRLMCCLRYEFETYKDFKSRAPKVGARIETPRGEAKVVALDAPRETVTILVQEEGRVVIPLEKMSNEGCQSHKPCKVSGEVLEEAIGAGKPALLADIGSSAPSKSGGQGDKPKSKRKRRSRGDGRSSGAGKPKKASDEQGEKKSSEGGGKRKSSRRRRRGSRGGSGRGGSRSDGQQKSGTQSSGDQQKKGSGSGSRQGGQGSGTSSSGQSDQKGGSSGSGGSGRRRRRRRPRSSGGDSPQNNG